MNRHIQVIFCDDIRYEVGNKISYMGVYNSQLLVNKFPVVIQKLVVAVAVVAPLEEPVDRLNISLCKNEDVLMKSELKKSSESRMVNENFQNDNGVPFKYQAYQTVFVLTQLLIDEPCTLKLYADTETGIIESLRLRIQKGST